MAKLNVIDHDQPECTGCGACCFHMGYPAFILPIEPKTEEQIQDDQRLRLLAKDNRIKEELLNGNPGEPHWHQLPEYLRKELEDFIGTYSIAEGELDPPCFWLDMKTRLCKHHEHRPRVCRDFEIGSTGCHEWRRHYASEIS